MPAGSFGTRHDGNDARSVDDDGGVAMRDRSVEHAIGCDRMLHR